MDLLMVAILEHRTMCLPVGGVLHNGDPSTKSLVLTRVRLSRLLSQAVTFQKLRVYPSIHKGEEPVLNDLAAAGRILEDGNEYHSHL